MEFERAQIALRAARLRSGDRLAGQPGREEAVLGFGVGSEGAVRFVFNCLLGSVAIFRQFAENVNGVDSVLLIGGTLPIYASNGSPAYCSAKAACAVDDACR